MMTTKTTVNLLPKRAQCLIERLKAHKVTPLAVIEIDMFNVFTQKHRCFFVFDTVEWGISYYNTKRRGWHHTMPIDHEVGALVQLSQTNTIKSIKLIEAEA